MTDSMPAQDSQARRAGRRDPHRDGPDRRPADAPRARHRRDRQPVRRPLRREPRRADRHRRGARRAARPEVRRRRSASRPARRRATARPRSSARPASSSTRPRILHPKLGAPLRVAVEKGAALVPSAKKRGTPRHRHRRAARPQGRRLRAQPFRRDRGARVRCAARQRDRGRGRRHRQRPAAAAHRRPAGPARSRAKTACAEPRHIVRLLPVRPQEFFDEPLRHVFSAAARRLALATALVPRMRRA